MTGLLLESIIPSFVFGAILGAIVALHLSKSCNSSDS